jgi:hypothetical protein
MLKIERIGNSLPTSFQCDPSASFMPGQIAELRIIGGQIMATVSNGTAPIGVIDDIRTKAFTNVSWNEVVIAGPIAGVMGPNGRLINSSPIKIELNHPHIKKNSLTTTVAASINYNNGVLTFPAGTELNYDFGGSGTPDSIRAIVNYTYAITNLPGDDSTQGSNRMTVWYDRFFFQTDQYETNQAYPLNANLFVSETGFLTTRQPTPTHPSVAMVVGPPSPMVSSLSVLWL